MRALRGDEGSGTLLVMAAGMLLAAVAVTVGIIATGFTAHRNAVRAADLAALAGAQRSLVDSHAACLTARTVAAANGAELRGCELQVAALQIEVVVPVIGVLPPIAATARAGLPSSLRSSSPALDDELQQSQGTGLVERVVAVATLR